MAEILIPLIVFMTPVLLYFTRNYFRLREKQLELQAAGGKLLPGRSEADAQRLKELEERVQNLESIVIALDSDRAALPGRSVGSLPTTKDAAPKQLAGPGPTQKESEP